MCRKDSVAGAIVSWLVIAIELKINDLKTIGTFVKMSVYISPIFISQVSTWCMELALRKQVCD